MSGSSTADDSPQAHSLQAEEAKPPSRGINVRAMMLLVVCAGATVWAGRLLWENYHPVASAVRELRSTDTATRAAAVRTLSEMGPTASGEVIRTVIAVLSDPEAGVRAAGAETLGTVGSYAVTSAAGADATRQAVAALTGLLKDKDRTVRAAAAGALGIIAGTAARPAPGSGRGGAGKTAKAASPASPVIDPMEVVNSLLVLLGDSEAQVRQEALGALRNSAPRVVDEPPPALLAATEDQSATNRAIAVGLLANFKKGLDPVVPILLRHLEQDEPSVREACSHAMGRIPKSAISSAVIPALIGGLESRDRDARMHTVSLLAGMSPDVRATVPLLIKILTEPADSDRLVVRGLSPVVSHGGPAQSAAGALARVAPGTPMAGQAIAALTGVVRSGPVNRRAAAAEALGQFGAAAASAVPELVAFLREGADSNERNVDGESAAGALAKIAPGTNAAGDAVAALTASLKGRSAETREAAVEALASFKPASADTISALRAIEKDGPSESIRKSAASTLEAIQGAKN
jgi:HEAT repeat protein